MNSKITDFIRKAAASVAKGTPNIWEDLLQEGALVLCERGGVWDDETRTTIVRRMSATRRELENSRERQLLNPFAEELGCLRDRRLVPNRCHIRGPRKSPKNKNERWRHKMMKLGRCQRCGSDIPGKEFSLCVKCRAKKSFYNRRSLNGKARCRKASQYDTVIKDIGWDLSKISLPSRAKKR